MEDFSINEMQKMQRSLQDKYKDRWEPICPETGQNKMLWMVGEIGEVIDCQKAWCSECPDTGRIEKRFG